MKGIILTGLFYVCCAVTGGLTGFGVCQIANTQETEPNIVTEDNTPVPEQEDGVFFDRKEETGTITPRPTDMPKPTAVLGQATIQEEEPVPTTLPIAEMKTVEEQKTESSYADMITEDDKGNEFLPSLGMLFAGKEPDAVVLPEISTETVSENRNIPEEPVAQTITIPAEIFGQTPVINHSDSYVSYFEFCYDLIARIEPKVQAKGLNMNVLLTKFALKALICGVDVEKVDINAPIPRRQAALCLHLAAQVLNEGSAETSAKSAEKYVTDISACSFSEKKAIAYLYEQGIIKGYRVPGQKFYPSEGLKTETGEEWLAAVVRCWK